MTSRLSTDDSWNSAYAEGDENCSWVQAIPGESLEAIERIAPALDAPIIDVGGGSSRLAECLLDRGHTDITVLDLSRSGLELARRRLGPRADRVTWVAADLLAWTPARTYALWHDRAMLHFLVEPVERAAYAARLRAALAPTGHAIIATFAPDGPERCSGLAVRRSDAAGVLRLLGPDFVAVRTETREHRTPSGVPQPFTWLIAQRAG